MRIVMTGATGLVGKALKGALLGAGHEVVPLVRKEPPPPGTLFWNSMSSQIDPAPLAGTDAVIHLAGESISSGRWTETKKRRIAESRIGPTNLLARTIAQLNPRPRVFLCASAIGFYGNRGEEILTEDSPPGTGFLADTCRQWEQASAPAAGAGIRVVHFRLGIVLSNEGGALAKLLTPFRLGMGGVVGNGEQYMSWIAMEDVVAALIHLLNSSKLAGAVNVVAPQPVNNRQFTHALGKVLVRPTLMPLPAAAARLMLGEMADELLLASARVVPSRLQNDGFVFKYPDLAGALAKVLL